MCPVERQSGLSSAPTRALEARGDVHVQEGSEPNAARNGYPDPFHFGVELCVLERTLVHSRNQLNRAILLEKVIKMPTCQLCRLRAHNPKVAGSNPAPATTKNVSPAGG
jgi:hypothetical protein